MNDALFQQAFAAHEKGDLKTAHDLYRQHLNANPTHFQTLYSLGRLYFQCGQLEEAERFVGEAARRNPHSPEAWFMRGSVLQRLDRHSEALVAFARALTEQPRFTYALVNRGASLMALKRYEEALKSFDAALKLDDRLVEAWNNRCNALSALGRSEEAIGSYNRVLALAPGMPQTLINLGTAYFSLKRQNEALESYDAALKLNPQSVDAFGGRGNALFEMKEYAAAAEAYGAALNCDPDYKYALGNFAFSRLHCCAWDGLDDIRRDTLTQLRSGKAVLSPFQAAALGDEASDHLRCAALWAEDKYPAAVKPLWNGELYRHEKIRIAYVSGDFREHAVAKLLVGVFEQHDRSRFEITGVSYGPDDGSALRTRMLAACDRVIDARDMSDDATARAMREAEIDVAVDLMGYTGDCRPGIFAHRPAPVQANFLGFPGTLGAGHFDYIVADATLIPESEGPFYRESVVRLPDTYMPWDSRQTIPPPPSRKDAGLPDDGFVFASFNNSYKFGPESFDVWMRLLHAVEKSVLWLHQGNRWAMDNLKREAEKRGIASSRLIFAPHVEKAENHLARLTLADLFLDTLPYNAHATAMDALAAGVPVLTLPGNGFPARVAASLVRAAGLLEMVVSSAVEYEALALKLAREPDALAAIKAKLAAHRHSAPLFDTDRFTRHLETAFTAMRTSRPG